MFLIRPQNTYFWMFFWDSVLFSLPSRRSNIVKKYKVFSKGPASSSDLHPKEAHSRFSRPGGQYSRDKCWQKKSFSWGGQLVIRAVKCFSEPFCFVIVIFWKKMFCYNTLSFLFFICFVISNWNNAKIVIVISIWNNVKNKNKHCCRVPNHRLIRPSPQLYWPKLKLI